jgi:predicted transposase YbfD/YdcC
LPKKTCRLILESGNDYVIAVKGNQPKLEQHIKKVAAQYSPKTRYITREETRDRVTTRTVEVFHNLTGIHPQWKGIQSLIRVDRIGTRRKKPYHETVHYISNLRLTAQDFSQGIRGHWGIENRLHWVKDVIFKEDCSTISQGHAPSNLSLVRAIAINLLRQNGYDSITTGQRLLSNKLDKLLSFME